MQARSRQNSDSDQFSGGDFFNALTDEDFDLLPLTKEERAELVNQEGNDTAHPTGKSIFHLYFVQLYVMGLKSLPPHM